jgi:hypothetical protein
MIEIHRADDMALNLVLDVDGLKELLAAFRQALHSGRAHVHLRLDPSVISKRGTPSMESVEVVRSSVNVPSLAKNEQGIQWSLGSEDLESGMEQLERALALGYFSPAEFLRVQVPKRKKLDWIYAECAAGSPSSTASSSQHAPERRKK